MIYSQGAEQTVIENYFNTKGIKKGFLVDIGANDGQTFSNSLALIQSGWKAILFEPNPDAYDKLNDLHASNPDVTCLEMAIGTTEGYIQLLCNSPHIENDCGLLSSLVENETEKWRDVGINFKAVNVEVNRWSDIMYDEKFVDFITIDAEGMDYDIMSQINLKKLGVRCLCIEWNSVESERLRMTDYAQLHGMREIFRNAENLIFVR